ncbi:hypothetical protein V1286_006983 [Bradyrhizobium algeriense]|uniref:Glycosyltransferase RgtA/B/C/D-like domain-containing protein n=1 Tax=Bradyrhizobium algeriense TaxID=634784 RepID=A0ABU8BLL9_9BRAD
MNSAAADRPQEGQVDMSAQRGPSSRWLLTALALVVVLAIPLFLVDVPPILDYPNHLARYFVLAHPGDPVLSQMYLPRWGLIPNLGMDVLGAGLLRLTDVHVGGRILLAFSLFAPVAGVVVFSRGVFGEFSYWPLASGTLAFNGIFHLGFMNFLLGLGLAFAAAAGWIVLRRRGEALAAVAYAVVATPVLFFCHLFGVLVFALLIGADEIARLAASRHAGKLTAAEVTRTGILLAIAISPAVVLYLAAPLAAGAAAPAPIAGVGYKLWTLLTPFMTTNISLTLWTTVIVIGFLAIAWRGTRVSPGVWIALGILAMVYLMAPSEIKGGTFVDVRLGMIVGLLFFAGFRPSLSPRQALVAGVIFATLIGARTIYIAATWIDHRQTLAELRGAMAQIAPASRVMIAHGPRASGTYAERPEWALPGISRLDGQLSALMVIEQRASWPLLFADPAQQPMEVTAEFRSLSQSPGGPVDFAWLSDADAPAARLKQAPYLKSWRADFDAVLLIDPPALLPSTPEGLTPVHAAPFAVLYRIQH